MGLGISIRLNDAPDETVNAAAFVEVHECLNQPATYRIEYSFDVADDDFPLLKEEKLGPAAMLSVLAPADRKTECLVKGPVYGQRICFAQGGAGSSLVVLGGDSLIKMDRENKAVAWSDMTDSNAVSAIVSQPQLGFVPDVEDTPASHLESKHTLIQRETDLRFVQRLARRNGNLFWLSSDEFGIETAHFKRPPLDGLASCDLIINLKDPRSTAAGIEISWDVERPTKTTAADLDLNTKSEVDGTVAGAPLTALGGSGLADIVTDSRIAHVRAPIDDTGDLRARSEGALIESSFFLHATGSTTFSALGKVLRAHSLVNLRGVGSRHSGLWFCAAVRHSIDQSEHRMDFDLIRNGWIN